MCTIGALQTIRMLIAVSEYGLTCHPTRHRSFRGWQMLIAAWRQVVLVLVLKN